MDSVSHTVVGLIDLPGDKAWSSDAVVRAFLDSYSTASGRREPSHGQFPGSPSSQQLSADLYLLRSDLDDLLQRFVGTV